MGRVMRRREAMRAVVRACGFTAQPLLRIAGVRGLCREFHHVRIGGGSAAKHVRAAARKGHPNLRRICPRMCPLRRACGAGVLQRRTQAVRDGFATSAKRWISRRKGAHAPSEQEKIAIRSASRRTISEKARVHGDWQTYIAAMRRATGPRTGARQFRSSFAARKRQPVSSSVSGRLSPTPSDASRVTPPILSRRSAKTGCPTAASRRFTSW